MVTGRPPGYNDRAKGEEEIIEALNEGEDTHSGLSERVDVTEGTVSKAVKKLEEKGEVEKYYKEGSVYIRLSEEMTNPIERTLRNLNKTTVRSFLDFEKGRELLTEEVIETIIDIYSLAWYEPASTWNLKIDEKAEDLYEIPGINVYKLLKGLARYFLEAKTLDWKTQDIPRHITFLEPRFLRVCVKHVKKGNEREKEFHNQVDLIKKISQKEKDNPVLFPVVNRCRERNVKDRFEGLLSWLKPLFCSQMELGNEKSVESEPSRGEKEERSLRDMYIDADNLAASVFRGEARTYANDQLARAWRYYLNSDFSKTKGSGKGECA